MQIFSFIVQKPQIANKNLHTLPQRDSIKNHFKVINFYDILIIFLLFFPVRITKISNTKITDTYKVLRALVLRESLLTCLHARGLPVTRHIWKEQKVLKDSVLKDPFSLFNYTSISISRSTKKKYRKKSPKICI